MENSPYIQKYRYTKDELLGHMEYMKRQEALYQQLEGQFTLVVPSATTKQSIEFYDNQGMFRIHHFNAIFGVNDDRKGLFSFGPTKQQRREGAAAVAMAGMFGAAIQAAKDGEVSEEVQAKVQDAMRKVEDAATSGLAEYSRRADAAEELVNG